MANVVVTELIDSSGLVEELAKAAAIRGLEACGMTAETYAKQDCPVDTGRLRNSIAHTVNEEELAAYIGSNVEYAPYQELGTATGVTAKHFLRNAAASHSEEYKHLIEESLKNA